MDLKELRIRRLDAKNIVIEQWAKPTKKNPAGKWRIIGYYGKLEDAALALLNLATEISEADDFAQQAILLAQNIHLAQNSIIEHIKSYQRAINGLSGQTTKRNRVKESESV